MYYLAQHGTLLRCMLFSHITKRCSMLLLHVKSCVAYNCTSQTEACLWNTPGISSQRLHFCSGPVWHTFVACACTFACSLHFYLQFALLLKSAIPKLSYKSLTEWILKISCTEAHESVQMYHLHEVTVYGINTMQRTANVAFCYVTHWMTWVVYTVFQPRKFKPEVIYNRLSRGQVHTRSYQTKHCRVAALSLHCPKIGLHCLKFHCSSL